MKVSSKKKIGYKMLAHKSKKRTRAPTKKQYKKVQKRPTLPVADNNNALQKPKNNNALLITQEVKFAKLLAHNDKKVRYKVLKNLKKWLTVRSQSSFAFKEEDFLRLWKGLFYCMWMSDKPLVQEELAESLSNLVHCFNSIDTALLYTKCTFKSLAIEWFGIDRYRVDKFEMLVRRILRQTFIMCKKKSWIKKCVIGVGKLIGEILLDPKTCLGLKLHIINIYMEELAKVSEEQIPTNMVTELVRPHVLYLATVDDKRQIHHIIKNVFRYLIFQSDIGIDYLEKYDAWKKLNFPCSSIDELEKVKISDDSDDEGGLDKDKETFKSQEKALDPRAGLVDVELPQLPFDASEIAEVLKENRFHKSSTTTTRRYITKLINQFSKLSEGEMPIGIKKIPKPEDYSISSYEGAEDLLKLNEELYCDSSNKNRKRKKKNGNITELFQTNELNISQTDGSEKISQVREMQKLDKYLSGAEEEKGNNDEIDDDDIDEDGEEVYKFDDNNDEADDDNDNIDNKNNDYSLKNFKKNNQKEKYKQTVKRKSENLNVSDSLPKKLKISSNNLNHTFSKDIQTKSILRANKESTSKKLSKNVNKIVKKRAKSKTFSKDNVNTCKNVEKNWSVEDALPLASAPSTPKPEKKITPEKNKVLLEKEANKKLTTTNVPWLTTVLTRLENQSDTLTSTKSALVTPKSTKNSIKIVLQKNTSQNTSEYYRQILQNPEIPFDANRIPKAGILKPSPIPSPINPFYKKKMM